MFVSDSICLLRMLMRLLNYINAIPSVCARMPVRALVLMLFCPGIASMLHTTHIPTRQSHNHKHREHHNNTYRQRTHQFDLMAVIFAIFCVRMNNFIMCFCYLDPMIFIHERSILYNMHILYNTPHPIIVEHIYPYYTMMIILPMNGRWRRRRQTAATTNGASCQAT